MTPGERQEWLDEWADGYGSTAYAPRKSDAMPPADTRTGDRQGGRQPTTPVRQAAERVVRDVSKAAETAAGEAAKRYGPVVGAWITRNAGRLAKGSLVGLAGVAAFWLTSKLRTLRFKTYDDLRYDLANQVRWARQRAAEGAGRPLTPDELAGFAQFHKTKLAEINAAQAAGRSITGVTNLIFGD